MSNAAILDQQSPGAIPQITVGKMGMWVFLVSEVMFFTGLIGSYIVLRLGSPSWPDTRQWVSLPLLSLNTMILLTSSLTMALSVRAAQEGDGKRTARQLLATVGLGTLFLVIKIADYVHMWGNGFTISTNLFSSCYYLLTIFHGLHMLSGIILLIVLWAGVRKGRYVNGDWGRIEYSGLYWHFIDAVWVILFAILGLI